MTSEYFFLPRRLCILVYRISLMLSAFTWNQAILTDLVCENEITLMPFMISVKQLWQNALHHIFLCEQIMYRIINPYDSHHILMISKFRDIFVLEADFRVLELLFREVYLNSLPLRRYSRANICSFSSQSLNKSLKPILVMSLSHSGLDQKVSDRAYLRTTYVYIGKLRNQHQNNIIGNINYSLLHIKRCTKIAELLRSATPIIQYQFHDLLHYAAGIGKAQK